MPSWTAQQPNGYAVNNDDGLPQDEAAQSRYIDEVEAAVAALLQHEAGYYRLNNSSYVYAVLCISTFPTLFIHVKFMLCADFWRPYVVGTPTYFDCDVTAQQPNDYADNNDESK